MKINTVNKPFRLAAIAAISLVGASMFASTAQAEAPVRTTGSVTDTTGSLSTSSLSSTLAAYQNSSGVSLRFVFVDSFDSYSADEWAGKTVKKSGLSSTDALVTVATNTNQFSYWAGSNSKISSSELQEAVSSSNVLDLWRKGEWINGATQVVSNLESSSTQAAKKGKRNSWLFIGSVVVIGGGGAGYLIYRKKKNDNRQARKSKESLENLIRQASSQLLSTDDGVRSAASELEFARAEFGIEATRPFAEALSQAQDLVQQAFVIRQQLEDDHPETPEQQYQMNEQIISLTSQAQQLISSQAEGFQNLRNLSSRVDQHLLELSTRANEIEAELPVLQAEIDNLGVTHNPESVSTLRTYPAQITAFLSSARSSIASGESAISSAKRNEAVSYARMAEETLAQASSRVASIKSADSVLRDAQSKLNEALRSISSDIADAERLGGDDPTIKARKEQAQQLVSSYSGRNVDPIKALTDLATAEDALDTALIGVRQADEVRQREDDMALRHRVLAETTIERVNSSINDYRFGIDGDVRGPLAKARQYIASGDASSDPATKAKFYKSALSAAQRAENELNQTFANLSLQSRKSSDEGSGSVGAFLAGMIISSIFDGNNRGHHSAGFGGFDADFGGFGGFGDGPSGSGGGGSF